MYPDNKMQKKCKKHYGHENCRLCNFKTLTIHCLTLNEDYSLYDNSKDDVDRRDQIPIVIYPKVEIEVRLDMLDDPGEADASEVEGSDDVVCGEDDLGDKDDCWVCNLHNDLKEDIERAEESVQK